MVGSEYGRESLHPVVIFGGDTSGGAEPGAGPGVDLGYPQGADVGALGPRRVLHARPSFAILVTPASARQGPVRWDYVSG